MQLVEWRGARGALSSTLVVAPAAFSALPPVSSLAQWSDGSLPTLFIAGALIGLAALGLELVGARGMVAVEGSPRSRARPLLRSSPARGCTAHAALRAAITEPLASLATITRRCSVRSPPHE